jgi:histidinol dehydrogenase
VRLERREAGADVTALVGEIRALVSQAPSVSVAVAAIVADVAARGDEAVIEYTERFDTDGATAPPLRVSAQELTDALAALDPGVRAGLEVAIANVAAVGWGGAHKDREVELPQGHRVLMHEVPVARAAVYVPGGSAPYPSTVVMGVVTARGAGVDEVVVCTPPPGDPVTLAACALTGVDEVYRVGGAQAIAALAYGTAQIPAVDVIVGPGNLYVQEAKRLVSDRVGIDGFAGPSDLMVLFDSDDAGAIRLIALDLLAQAEHGRASIVVAVAADEALLDALAADLAALSAAREPVGEGTCVLVQVDHLERALELANAYAPEHLELVGPAAELLAPRVRTAGVLFIGWPGATAFGDYVAGSNHILPTAGSARFSSGLRHGHFRREMAEVRINPDALAALAGAGGAIADAEGFKMHAESMRARVPAIVENSPE